MCAAMKIQARSKSEFWFTCVDINVLRDPSLSSWDKAAYGVICSHADGENPILAHPSKSIQKILDATFLRTADRGTKDGSEKDWELQKRYTNEEAEVDARALLRQG